MNPFGAYHIVQNKTIGSEDAMKIPLNGYLAVYLSNGTQVISNPSLSDVYFDDLRLQFTKGNLRQEVHYYPFGLPMSGIGSSDITTIPNRQKYQSNEHKMHQQRLILLSKTKSMCFFPSFFPSAFVTIILSRIGRDWLWFKNKTTQAN